MSAESLIIPVQLDALVVNKGVLDKQGDFRHWQFNYQALQSFMSPEASAFSGSTGKVPKGIYLHWNLPRALRSGMQERSSGKIAYPLVPNRWLLVRVYGTTERNAKAWILESDCPLTSGVKQVLPDYNVAQTSLYPVNPGMIGAWKKSADKLRNTISLNPDKNGPQHVNMGITFPLEKGWSERTSGTSFLTAVAPGNPAFSIYYAHNVGVFSMYDDLQGIDNTKVSYFLTGWYSDAGDDILNSWQKEKEAVQAYKSLLTRLDWKETTAGNKTADRSYYQGMALSIEWNANGDPPKNDPLKTVDDSGSLNVSLGNTTIDAFSALVEKQLEVSAKNTQPAKFLRAFQYDLLPLLNTVNGEALLENRIRQEWFRPDHGGTRWIITAKDKNDASVLLTDDEAEWLSKLNEEQEKYDEALTVLMDLQWQLNAAWWKVGRDPDQTGEDVTTAQLRNYLDPENPEGITARVVAQTAIVNNLRSPLPQPDWNNAANPEAALTKGIQAFSLNKKLSNDKVLKPVSSPRHWKATDPVMTISGLEPSPAADPDELLQTRYSSELITALTTGSKKADMNTLPKELKEVLSKGTLPAICTSLLTEFILCDPDNAAALSKSSGIPQKDLESLISKHDPKSYSGTLPSSLLNAWSQPWEPIFAEWHVTYSHIPFGKGEQLNWKFNGTDYSFEPDSRSVKTQDRDISVGSSRVDLQACKLEYSIVSPK